MLVGHEPVRQALRHLDPPFTLTGPAGVGKRLVVAEWTQNRRPEDRSRPEVVTARPADWPQLAARLDRGDELIMVSDSPPPPPIRGRAVTLTLGHLTRDQILAVLTEDHPKLQPRQTIAHLCSGSLADLDAIARTARTLDALNTSLAHGQTPRLDSPEDTVRAVHLLAVAILTRQGLPIGDHARQYFTLRRCRQALQISADLDKHRARNALALLFASHG